MAHISNYYSRWEGTRNFSQIESQQKWRVSEEKLLVLKSMMKFITTQ
jgi:hypothetical protein